MKLTVWSRVLVLRTVMDNMSLLHPLDSHLVLGLWSTRWLRAMEPFQDRCLSLSLLDLPSLAFLQGCCFVQVWSCTSHLGLLVPPRLEWNPGYLHFPVQCPTLQMAKIPRVSPFQAWWVENGFLGHFCLM